MTDKPLIRADHCHRSGCGDARCKATAVFLVRPNFSERADGVLIPYVELKKDEVRELIAQLTELERGMPWN